MRPVAVEQETWIEYGVRFTDGCLVEWGRHRPPEVLRNATIVTSTVTRTQWQPLDERSPQTCPRCGQVCTYDGWDHVHPSGLGIRSCQEDRDG